MPSETLHIVTLSVCLFTLTLATAALMPQLKRALVLVRDAMLGAMFVFALSLAGFVIWGFVLDGKFSELRPSGSAESSTNDSGSLTEQETLDPLLLPSIEDEIAENQHRYGHGAVVSTVPVGAH